VQRAKVRAYDNYSSDSQKQALFSSATNQPQPAHIIDTKKRAKTWEKENTAKKAEV
jgi:hypothetical protein